MEGLPEGRGEEFVVIQKDFGWHTVFAVPVVEEEYGEIWTRDVNGGGNELYVCAKATGDGGEAIESSILW